MGAGVEAVTARPGRRPGAVFPGGAKSAAKLAERIIGEVSARGWPVGEVIGSEKEMLERYQVSRAVFREAVRIVEHQGVARTRRGPGGGLVVTEPPVQAVMDAVAFYLYRTRATLDEVFEARKVVEGVAVEVAVDRMTEDAAARALIEDLVGAGMAGPGRDPREFHHAVARATANPAVELLVDVLSRVALLYAPGWKRWAGPHLAGVAATHVLIAEKIAAGDGVGARALMDRHLEDGRRLISGRPATLHSLPHSSLDWAVSGKRAGGVAWRLARRIVDRSLSTGSVIGTEAELMQEEGVSRAVLREAVRLLEHHHVAGMRRGPGGGLVVLEPTAVAAADMAAIFLARQGLRVEQASELRRGVEQALEAGASASTDGRVLELIGLMVRGLE